MNPYIIRQAHRADQDLLASFIANSKCPMVEPRTPAAYAKALASEDCFLVIDQDGQISGCACAYRYETAYSAELGSALIFRPHRAGIYQFLTALRVAKLACSFPGLRHIFCNVDTDNPQVREKLVALGFMITTVTPSFLEQNLRTIDIRKKEVQWMECPAIAIPKMASQILDRLDHLSNPEVLIALDDMPIFTEIGLKNLHMLSEMACEEKNGLENNWELIQRNVMLI